MAGFSDAIFARDRLRLPMDRFHVKGLAVIILCFQIVTSGCTSTTSINVNNESIDELHDNPLGTYSDYGGKITYDEKMKLYRLNVYVGGLGSCDQGAVLYAKPKLEKFMKSENFSTYKVVKGEYSIFPFSKCELFIIFD